MHDRICQRNLHYARNTQFLLDFAELVGAEGSVHLCLMWFDLD